MLTITKHCVVDHIKQPSWRLSAILNCDILRNYGEVNLSAKKKNMDTLDVMGLEMATMDVTHSTMVYNRY